MAGYYIIAAVCGILVSGTEIISRYRDEPLLAVCCRDGLAYLAINGLLSTAAFWVFSAAGTFTETTTTLDFVKYAVFAGFGAAVVMRAKVFNLSLESGEGVGIGPDMVINALLKMLDRQIDRNRAIDRARVVRQSMANIDYDKVRMPLISMLTRSMQTLTDEEVEKMGKDLKELDESTILSSQQKSYALGFIVLDLAGGAYLKKYLNKKERAAYTLDETVPA